MKRIKKFILPTVIGVTIAFFIAALYVRLPYYIEVPGGAEDVRQVLIVDNKADKEAGSYNFVTVGVEQATFAHLVYAWLTPFTDIYSAKDMTGGSTDDEFNRINQFYMETSQNMAKYQGLTTAGKEIKMDYLGVYVLQVADNSTFKGVLNIADTVTGVNDKTFESSEELVKYVNSQKLGDKVKVTFQEDGQEKSATGKIIKLENGKNGIGISRKSAVIFQLHFQLRVSEVLVLVSCSAWLFIPSWLIRLFVMAAILQGPAASAGKVKLAKSAESIRKSFQQPKAERISSLHRTMNLQRKRRSFLLMGKTTTKRLWRQPRRLKQI